MKINGTKSEQNIKSALMGESIARNKYTFYAMQAKKEGHPEIAELFERMAGNESIHAKIWFHILNNGLGTTTKNLMDAAQGENGEWMTMYPNFAKIAREEGLEELAVMFDKVAEIEADHEKTFLQALANLSKNSKVKEENNVQEQPKKQGYRCMFCGAKYESRPDVCSTCEAIGSFEGCEL